jgi:uncharacterized protein
MKFEWDEAKRRTNLTRHGFDFEQANQVFAGVTDTVSDDRFDYGERRFVTFGFLGSDIVMIVHTESDDGKKIRIISMRKATKHEAIAFLQKIWY